ncbi:MAG TPA: hypothetical protein GX526_00370 [Thermoanaerobacterales bacterium]|nr:hypothetical protein [Thermoanaerobacterales bacterium]
MLTYEEITEKIQRLGCLVLDEKRGFKSKPTFNEKELVRLQELRKTYPEYEEEKRKADILLSLHRLTKLEK